jgi:GT2 family glycosyltransferase
MPNDVTVVIPTRNRPDLVVRSVRSALAQTYPVSEIIVVVDGPDDVTAETIAGLNEPRARAMVLPVNGGANNARNQGAANAKTEWVAFLDDDDEWLPEKIERQMAVSANADIVSCRFSARTAKGASTWPRRLPSPGEKFGDYLFSRRSIFNGEAAVITSTLMIRKSLLDKMPFTLGLKRHQEADWCMRSTSTGARVAYAPEMLMVFYDDSGRVRISTTYNWRQSVDWIRSIRERGYIGPRAYAGFLLPGLGAAAATQHDWSAFSALLKEAFKNGRPTVLHLVLYFGMWAFPHNLRRRLQQLLIPARSTKVQPSVV